MSSGPRNIEQLLGELSRDVSGTVHEAYLNGMKGRYEHLLRRLAGLVPSGRVLDAGASPGLITLLLQRAGYDAFGLDFLPHERFPAADGKKVTNLFVEYSVPVAAADIVSAPFPLKTGSFDAALLNETIEHFTGSPLPCLREIKRVLRPGGIFILSTPNAVSLSNRLRFLSGRNIYTEIETLVNVAPYKLHNREYAMYEIDDLLKRAGFEVIERQMCNFGGAPATGFRAAARQAYYAATALIPSGKSNLFAVARA